MTTAPLLLNTVSGSLVLIFLSSLVLWPPPLCYWIPSLVHYYWFFFLLWYCDHRPFVIEYRLWFITIDFFLLLCYCDHRPFVTEYRLWFITIDFSFFFGIVTTAPLLLNTVSALLLLIFLSSLVLWPPFLCYWIPSLVYCYWFFFLLWCCDHRPFVIEYRLWFISIDFSFFFGIVTTAPLLLNTVCGSLLLIFLSSLVLWPPSLCYWIPSLVHLYWFFFLLWYCDHLSFVIEYCLWFITIDFSFFFGIVTTGPLLLNTVSVLLLLIFLSSLVLWPPPLCYSIPSLDYYYWFFLLLWYCDHRPFVIEYRLWFITIDFSFFFGIVTTAPLLFNTVSGSFILIFLSSLVLWPPPLCYWILSLVCYYWFFFLLWFCDHYPFVIEYRLWFITIDFSFFLGIVTTGPLLLNTVSGSLLLIFLSSLVLWPPPLCYWIPSLVYYYWFFFLLWYCDHHSFVIEYRLWFITIDFSFFFGIVTTAPLLLNTVSGSLLLIFLSSLVLWPPVLCYWIPSLFYYYWFFFLLWYCDHRPFVIQYCHLFITIDFSFFFGIVTTGPLLLNTVSGLLLLIFLSSLVLWPQPLCYWIPSLVH